MPGLRDSSRRTDSKKSGKSDHDQGKHDEKSQESSPKQSKKSQKQQKQQHHQQHHDDDKQNKDRRQSDPCLRQSTPQKCPRDDDVDTQGPCCGRRGCPTSSPVEEEPIYCAKCEEEINEGPTLTVLGRKWHPDCFTCDSCGEVLAKTPFFLDGDVPFCSACWSRNVKSTCSVS